MPILNDLKQKVTKNTLIIFRIVLFLTFFGHGLVSLGFSPSTSLHYSIVDAVNFTNWSVSSILMVQGWIDIVIALLLLTGLWQQVITALAIVYLTLVGIAAWIFFWKKTDNIFGMAEAIRRLPWILFALFLFLSAYTKQKKYSLLRIGISMAFLAHGIASLGFFGLNGGHIELAANILSPELAATFVFYTGISDTILGLLLLSGILSRYAALVGIIWIAFIVVLSAMTAFPDALFRLGFLVSIIYVAIDARCHPNYFSKSA